MSFAKRISCHYAQRCVCFAVQAGQCSGWSTDRMKWLCRQRSRQGLVFKPWTWWPEKLNVKSWTFCRRLGTRPRSLFCFGCRQLWYNPARRAIVCNTTSFDITVIGPLHVTEIRKIAFWSGTTSARTWWFGRHNETEVTRRRWCYWISNLLDVPKPEQSHFQKLTS